MTSRKEWVAYDLEELLRARHAAGDPRALMEAVATAAEWGLPLPAWAATAFIAAYNRVGNYEVASWDEAFGRPFPKNAKLGAMRDRRALRVAVWSAVQTALRNDPSARIHGDLFDQVGRRFGIGKTLAESYYRDAARVLGKPKRG